MHPHTHVVHNAYSPKETFEQCSRAGVTKANMRMDKTFISAVLAGCLLSFACGVVLIVNASPWYQENAPGLIKMIGAIVFPFGLVLILATGADLCTASFMFMTIPVLHGRLSIWKGLRHWFISFWGNLAGSLFIVAIITGYGGTLSAEPAFRTATENFANQKVVNPGWEMIFLRGIGANWLVCLACFLCFMAREYVSKVVAIWWPTFAFVCLGFDHVVANMFFIPAAIWLGSPRITVGYYIWKSMIPTLIGNIIGGNLFVGTVYWYMFVTGEDQPVPIDGVYYSPEDAPLHGVVQSDASGTNTPAAGEEKKSAENMV